MANNNQQATGVINEVLDRCSIVVYQTRTISTERDTGNIVKSGAKTVREQVTTFDHAALKPINAEKQRGARLCQQYGTKVESLAAWLVPNDKVDFLMNGLTTIKHKVDELANELAENIGELVADYAAKNPKQKELIQKYGPDEEEVRKSTKILFAAYRVRSEDVQDAGGLSEDMTGLHVQALNEFAVALRDAKANPSGRMYTDGIKNVLGRIASKAKSLAFLHPVLEEVAVTVEQCVSSLPPGTRFEGYHAVALGTLISQLMDPARLIATGGFQKLDVDIVAPDDAPVEVTSQPVTKKASPAAVVAW